MYPSGLQAANADERPLLDATALRQLERLSLAGVEAVVRGFGGQRAGAGHSRGLEFIDYRRYTPGDDLRNIDWNVYARLREVVVKTAPSEAHVDLALMLDASASMGSGDGSKFRHAQELAALLGTVALLGSDAIAVDVLADGGARAGVRLTAPHVVPELIAELGALPRGTRTDLTASLREHRRGSPMADLAVLVTDALVDPADLGSALAELAASGGAATLVHVVESGVPELPDGTTELLDAETGERIVVELTAELRRAFGERRAEEAAAVRELCAGRGVAYLAAPVEVAALDLMFGAARDVGLVSA
ncbi:MAG TPA: DUF58 domain-containing protein [Solirubrobacterales bacterium]|nr:DUF58 domain-containing protein [Solirubrobacterales bacterium]